eukprot:gene17601-8795_t
MRTWTKDAEKERRQEFRRRKLLGDRALSRPTDLPLPPFFAGRLPGLRIIGDDAALPLELLLWSPNSPVVKEMRALQRRSQPALCPQWLRRRREAGTSTAADGQSQAEPATPPHGASSEAPPSADTAALAARSRDAFDRQLSRT